MRHSPRKSRPATHFQTTGRRTELHSAADGILNEAMPMFANLETRGSGCMQHFLPPLTCLIIVLVITLLSPLAAMVFGGIGLERMI
jgi:hypothetical protein